MNSVRSAMAENILKHMHGGQIYVDSVGVHIAEMDQFAIEVMAEMGIDMSGHKPKSFDDLEDLSFDLVISLSPEAQHTAVEMTRTMACELEYWPTFDATYVQGSRRQILLAYREARDLLRDRIVRRFSESITISQNC